MSSQPATPEARAERRAHYLTGLVWHVGAFVIINAFFWILDAVLGAGGITWAFWITLFWGFALVFHALAYVIDGTFLEQRRASEYARRERERMGRSPGAPAGSS
ncbi:MAG: 2TM domain-containing protein [Actinomycetota bacterium]|nr:2TM domain-containing protein [Actinomycetota bacterium]